MSCFSIKLPPLQQQMLQTSNLTYSRLSQPKGLAYKKQKESWIFLFPDITNATLETLVHDPPESPSS